VLTEGSGDQFRFRLTPPSFTRSSAYAQLGSQFRPGFAPTASEGEVEGAGNEPALIGPSVRAPSGLREARSSRRQMA
jgi:hypothetical protein